MRRLLLVLPLFALTLAVGMPNCGGLVLTAQSLPATLHAQWNPNPVSDAVTDYQLRLDGTAPVTIPLSVCTATLCRTAFTVPTYGAHSVTLSARNLKLSADPTSVQEGAQSAPIPFTLNQVPQTAVAGVQVTQ